MEVKNCNHRYSKAMGQPFPRKCIDCGKPELIHDVVVRIQPCIDPEENAIEMKRFYPPFNIEWFCPNCQHKHYYDGYLSYPSLGEPLDFNLYCGLCDKEFEVKVQLDMTMKVV